MQQRSPVGNIASMSTWRQELPMLQGNLCMMRDTSGHRQPLQTFSLIAVRANYYPTISIQFDHPHYHFIANISFIPTWGIISVKYTHYGRLLWAALLIIPAHMDNGSSKKKQKKNRKAELWAHLEFHASGLLLQLAFLWQPLSLHIPRLQVSWTPSPFPWKEWVLGQPRFSPTTRFII